MNEGEAVRLLARWVAELQTDLETQRERNELLAGRVTELEHQVSGFAYWMRTAKTPARIRQLAGTL